MALIEEIRLQKYLIFIVSFKKKNQYLYYLYACTVIINIILFKKHINPDKDKCARKYDIDFVVSIIKTTSIILLVS